MNGTMKIEVKREPDGERIDIETRLHDVGLVERVKLLCAFCDALEIDTATILTMMAVRDLLHEAQESIRVEIDDSWRHDR